MTVFTPTDRPNLVNNRCVIEVFGGVFVLSRCFSDFSVRCRGFYHRTDSDLLLFLLSMPRQASVWTMLIWHSGLTYSWFLGHHQTIEIDSINLLYPLHIGVIVMLDFINLYVFASWHCAEHMHHREIRNTKRDIYHFKSNWINNTDHIVKQCWPKSAKTSWS